MCRPPLRLWPMRWATPAASLSASPAPVSYTHLPVRDGPRRSNVPLKRRPILLDKKDKKNKYWQLFLSTFKLSACTFGGGFVIIPLMRERFVKELHWIEEEEMLDLTAIAQSLSLIHI